MIEILLDEDTWLILATALGGVAALGLTTIFLRRHARGWTTATMALNLFFALWIGIMGTGHLTAVTIKAVQGVLPPNIHLWIALPFGLAIAVPGWWLLAEIPRLVREEARARKAAILLNAWLVLVLLIPAAPVAAVAAVNCGLLMWKLRGRDDNMAAASA
ncbi:MAG: hypothetical protein ACRD4U_06280 [Candidatus Acidiferrales bacterium]